MEAMGVITADRSDLRPISLNLIKDAMIRVFFYFSSGLNDIYFNSDFSLNLNLLPHSFL